MSAFENIDHLKTRPSTPTDKVENKTPDELELLPMDDTPQAQTPGRASFEKQVQRTPSRETWFMQGVLRGQEPPKATPEEDPLELQGDALQYSSDIKAQNKHIWKALSKEGKAPDLDLEPME